MGNQDEKILWVEWIRVLATIGVIFIHTTGPTLYKYNEIPETFWWIGNVYDSTLRMCVPLFFMISGFLLLQKDYSLKVFFLKRFNKVLIPLLAWSVFFVTWKIYYEHSASLSSFSLVSLLHEPAYYHLWFLYALIGMYLSIPLLRIIVKHCEKTILYYGLALWVLTASYIPMFEYFTETKGGISLKFLAGYSGYLLLGWILAKQPLCKKKAVIACFLAFICIAITAVGTYVLTTRNGGMYSGFFYGPLAPNVIVLAGSVFLVIRYVVENYGIAKDKRVLSVVQSISASSFGIYMIHLVFIHLLNHGHLGFYLRVDLWHPLFSIPVVAMATFCLSYGTIHFLRKISISVVAMATLCLSYGTTHYLKKKTSCENFHLE